MRPGQRGTRWFVAIGLGISFSSPIAVAVVAQDASPSVPSESQSLEDLGRLYAEGQPGLAVAAVTRWDRDKVEAEVSRLRSNWDGAAERRDPALRAAAIVVVESARLDLFGGNLVRGRWKLRCASRLVAAADDPTSERFARLFYLVSGLVLHSVSDVGAALAILDEGLGRFKADPELLVAKGAIVETVAGLRVYDQPPEMGPASLLSNVASGRPSPPMRRAPALARDCFSIEGVQDGHDCLASQTMGRAQDLYSGALAQNSELAEARLRLGHVRLLQKDARGALLDLERVASEATLPSHRYLARLFEGQAREELGDLPGAVAAYEAATREAPDGQAALIALGRARGHLGERVRAQEAYARALRPSRSEDPWWAYLHGQPDRMTSLLDELRGQVQVP